MIGKVAVKRVGGYDPGETHRLELTGHVPSKANNYRVGRGKAFYMRSVVLSEIGSLAYQLNVQWAGKRPLEHPEVTLYFHTENASQDRDNQVKTILDLLQAQGVIVNDNSRHFNGWLHIAPTVITSDEKVIIELR